MGSKMATAGGGQATGVANDFNNFLNQGLQNGSFGTIGQTQGFGGAINGLLNGASGVNPGAQNFGQALGNANAGGGFQAQQIGNTMQGVNPIGGNNFNFGQGLNQGIGQASMPQFNPNSISYSLGGGGVDLSQIMSQMGQSPQLAGLGGTLGGINQAAQNLGGMNTSTQNAGANSSVYGAVSQLAQNQAQRDIGDLRARYGAQGGANGSSAMNAEALYRAQALPNLINSLNQVGSQQRQLSQGDIAAQIQAQQAGLQGLLGGANTQVTGRGQDLYSQLQSRGMDISSLGLASQQSLGGIQNLLAQRGQDIGQAQGLNQGQLTNIGQNLGMQQANLGDILQNRGLDINQLGMMSQNQLGNRGMDINSMLGQGQLGLQTGMANQGAGLQQQQLLQQLLNQYGGQQLGYSGLAQQGQLGALANLFGSMNEANRLGTPQAQNYQQPSAFQNFIGGVNGITGMLKGISNLFNPFSSAGVPGGGQAGISPDNSSQMGTAYGMDYMPDNSGLTMMNPAMTFAY